jgi:Family of unknown function (DUF6776)
MSIPRKRIKTPNIAATSNRGNSKWLIVILILFVVCTWAAYQFGRDGFELDVIDLPEQDLDSGRQLEQLRSEYKTLKRRADALVGLGASSIQETTSGEITRLRDEPTKPASEMTTISESAAEHNLQLKIKDIQISPGKKRGSFEYKVSIEPIMGVDGMATGMLKLAISGATNGKPEVVEVPQKAEGLEDNHRVFDLSQDLTGILKLPNKFLPEAVTLELITGNDTANPLTHRYAWSDVLSKTRAVRTFPGGKNKIIEDLTKENLALKIKLSKIEVSGQSRVSSTVSSDPTIQELEQQRDSMAQEIEQLKQKVIDLKGRFVIRNISINTKGTDDGVEFKVTVSRSINDGERIHGSMTVSLAGTEDKEEKIYTLEKLTSNQKSDYVLGFKNYQEIKQPLLVPKGFDPEKVIIRIVAENTEMEEFNQEFDWKKLTK